MSENSDTIAAEPAGGEPGLSGKMLIAMPSMGDPRFEKAVIYLCAHSEEGALGIVVNRRADSINRKDLLSQLQIECEPEREAEPVHFGGPVETGRGFVLHSTDWTMPEATLEVDGVICMTATVDVLKAIAAGAGPRRSMIALGYAGWGEGQLEGELRDNGWLTCDGDEEIIFGDDDASKWTAALAKLGIDPMMLSASGGTA